LKIIFRLRENFEVEFFRSS